MQREERHVGPKFQKNHKLKKSTTPGNYAEIFLPFSINMEGNEDMVIFGKITKWTNLKAVISSAG